MYQKMLQIFTKLQYFIAKNRAPMGSSEGTNTPIETALVAIKASKYHGPEVVQQPPLPASFSASKLLC